jgi:hypothetical protein
MQQGKLSNSSVVLDYGFQPMQDCFDVTLDNKPNSLFIVGLELRYLQQDALQMDPLLDLNFTRWLESEDYFEEVSELRALEVGDCWTSCALPTRHSDNRDVAK